MMSQVLHLIGKAALVFIGLYVAWTIYLAFVLRWEDDRSVGLGYYGRDRKGRERFRRQLKLHALLLSPILRFNSKLTRMDFKRARVTVRDVSFPAGSCDTASVERAVSYQPQPQDVFVVTQMKCGTTWMEHVVFQVVNRGTGDLVETGRALYAVAPWIEGRRSVPIDQAPLVGGARPTRLIKSHLPAQLCPRDGTARFIYVARHPASCFASCVDFIRTNVGSMTPPLPACEAWFCSPELMWWGTWTDHVRGWWERNRQDGNVLFVRFEEMKKDLASVVRRVAEFLGVAPLNDGEMAQVLLKCGFDYMQEHDDSFEMHPPHVLQTNAALFVSGTADRHKDLPDDIRARILGWAAAGLAGSDFPLAQSYPDVAAAGT
ncbi:MAG TPA: sulfotransferase domain-containing protein [Gemmatimonadales bacterium]|jgi:hypothetical protein